MEAQDKIVWIYEEKACEYDNIKQVFRQKSGLKDEDILKALNVVLEKAKKNGQSRIIVKENDNSFDFEIDK